VPFSQILQLCGLPCSSDSSSIVAGRTALLHW